MAGGADISIVGQNAGAKRRRAPSVTCTPAIPLDPHRHILFPNAIRERRLAVGLSSLLALAQRLPHIPYIRLSKIERGEVFARAEELWAIARALGEDDPERLLVDVDAPGFALDQWPGARIESRGMTGEAEELAMLLAAALRRLRAERPALTLALLLTDYRLPAVIISRLENAVKPFHRWNAETLAALCALFDVADRVALAALLWREFESGGLDEWLARIPGAQQREARTRARIAALRKELAHGEKVGGVVVAAHSPLPDPTVSVTRGELVPQCTLQVLGVPLGDGLIEPFPNPQHVAPPPGCGPRSYALRMCRASLGAAIPGGAVLIVDPDRAAVQTGLAVFREGEGLRVLALSTDRQGRLVGHSSNPEKTILLDDIAPADIAPVVAVLFP